MYRLKITRTSSLLSTEADQEITPDQVSSVKALLKSDTTYGELLAFLSKRRQIDMRREGIDQYQAEGR